MIYKKVHLSVIPAFLSQMLGGNVMKKRVLSLLLAFCVVLAVMPAVAIEADAATSTINGKVVDITGNAVPAKVSVYAQSNGTTPLATTTANENTGEFTVSRSGGFDEGTYMVKAEYSIYLTTTTSITILSGDGFTIATPDRLCNS